MNITFDELVIFNFKCFNGLHKIKFGSPGLYYVMGSNLVEPELGSNGVGKSSLIDAFYWCWSGKTIGDNRPGAAVEPWEGHEGNTSVQTKFHWNKQPCYLVRTRKPNSLSLNGEAIDQSALQQLLGMSEDNLRRTLIVGQKGDLFLDLGPEDQSRMFTEMLDLDLWISAAELASKKAIAADRIANDFYRAETEANGKIQAFEEQLDKEIISNLEFEEQKQYRIESSEKQVCISEVLLDEHNELKPPKIKPLEIKSLEDELKDIKTSLVLVGKKSRELSDKSSELNSEITLIKKTISRYASLQNNICPECEQKVSKEHLREKIQHYEKVKEALAKKHAPVIEELGETNLSLDKFSSAIEVKETAIRKEKVIIDQLRERFDRWDRKRLELSNNLERDKLYLDQAEKLQNPHIKIIDQLKLGIDRAKKDQIEYQKKRDGAKWEYDTYKYWISAYKEIRLKLIDEVLLEIEVSANRHAGSLGLLDWQIKFATERTTKSNTISRGFSTFIYPPGLNEPIRWESYSGGEEQRWRLAVTFALSEVLLARAGLESNLEILDEPTAHLSDNGITDLLDCLHDRSLDSNRCIYLVDHHSLDKGNFNGVILVERTSSGAIIKYI